MRLFVYLRHSDVPELASGASNLWWRNYLYNVTHLIKHFIRSACPCPQVTCPYHDRYLNTLPHYSCHFTWAPSYLTTVTNWTLIIYGSPHFTEGEGNAWDSESGVLQGVTSSMLGSFCPDTYHILSISSSKLYSAACFCLINSKFGNGLHVIPGFHIPRSIGDVSLRHMQHLWLTLQLLCHKGGNILWTLHNHIIVFANNLPSDNWLCTPTNTVDDTFSMVCGKVFLWSSAIDVLGHIIPLGHELYSMMVPSCEILVTKLHSVMILVVLHI